jgi:uncharacterized protein
MKITDFERARNYALARLDSELSPTLYYHSLGHTRDFAVPAAERLADMEGVISAEKLLLVTAAYFHDLGYLEQMADHERISARIAAEKLPSFGCSAEQIEVIQGIILATRLPQTPHTLLEEIMADADLDVLGSHDFLIHNQELRAEMAALGSLSSDESWYRSQLDFLRSHRYFTVSQRRLRDGQKNRNIAALAQLLADSQIDTLMSG